MSVEDGTVQAWRKKSDVPLWSFSSGPPLTSFERFSKDMEDGEGEEDEEDWDAENFRVAVEENGLIRVHDTLNQSKVKSPSSLDSYSA